MGGGSSRPEDRDLTGRVAVVTGASSGLGYETAKNLARMGARTILACRNAEKTEEAMARMREELGSEVSVQLEFMLLDLSSFQSTKEFTEAFKEKDVPLDILVNNAAVAFVAQRRTQDGFESHYQVNHLSHFLLTLELLPCLKRAADEHSDARVVVVSSVAHTFGVFNPANMNGEESYSRPGFYGNSKLYNVMFAYSLQRRVTDDKITVSTVNPGAVKSNFYNEAAGESRILRGLGWALVHLPFYKSPAQGAATSLDCAVNPDLNTCTMHYYKNCAVTESSELSRNVQMQKQLWQMSVSAVQEYLSHDIMDKYGGVKEEEEEVGDAERPQEGGGGEEQRRDEGEERGGGVKEEGKGEVEEGQGGGGEGEREEGKGGEEGGGGGEEVGGGGGGGGGGEEGGGAQEGGE